MNELSHLLNDIDPSETNEWTEALQAVLEQEGPQRAHYLIEQLVDLARRSGVNLPYKATTAYVNTIPVEKEPPMPGDEDMEARIQSIIRWNALAMVLRAGKRASELGGHIASFASSATLYDVGFNHFFHAPTENHGGDLLYIQGHTSPGIYSRSFLEGRLSELQLENFRQEVEKDGLASYPHPWLMPDYWQFPTVSMGLGPLQAIYQARFMKYLHNRGIVDTSNRKVWCFCGDGEMDEPESLGAISLAGREKLDNLIFVINCNLQRLDGPVRGNGKIIQELEGVFRGAGWNAIKVLWGRLWDPLFAKDTQGLLRRRMEEAVDGDYQNYKAHDGGSYTREHFFGKYPELKEMVADMTDEEIWALNRGGHDARKVYAAYKAAVDTTGMPTVILAKTIKGFGMGTAGEAQNITHQQKKMDVDSLKRFCSRFKLPLTDQQIEKCEYYRPAEDSAEIQYLKERRKKLGGYLPARNFTNEVLQIPSLDAFASLLQSTGERTISTTMAFVRILSVLTKDPQIKDRIVPIIPDEARTFGMEGFFRQLGIYSSVGQLYQPVDSDQVMYYREDKKGQILEEGITEAGAFCSWIAAATSYSTHGVTMIPFYIFYSMFGFQRIGDLAWGAGDSRARGFLLGATAGRTTLAGEGLQHQDGHSHVLASAIPNCITYDPTYAYELAVIVHDGLRRMYVNHEDIYYYISVMNENYTHPEMPKGVEEGILRGIYLLHHADKKAKNTVQLFGCGTILREVEAAAKILKDEFDVDSNVWSVTSFNELRKDGLEVERWNLMHPAQPQRKAYITQCLENHNGPIIAATDYMRAYAEQVRPYLSQKYYVLGTDGFGRSDTRKALRHFFEVDARYVVVTALRALADEGKIAMSVVEAAMKKFEINPEKPTPWKV